MKHAQNLIEFVYIFPLVVFLGLAVFELALFWKSVNTVNMINEEIASNAVLSADIQGNGICIQAQNALDTLKKRDIVFTQYHLTYKNSVVAGQEPYAQYRFYSDQKFKKKPMVVLDVDCQNPEKAGITTQLRYQHHLSFIPAKIPGRGSNEPIEIFPSSVEVISARKKVRGSY